MCSPLFVFLAFTHRLSLCDCLWTVDTISGWLVVILHVSHTLPIFHEESSWSWNVLATKDVLFSVFQRWSKFLADASFFFLVLRRNDCHCPNETATVGSRGTQLSSAQTSHLFRNTAISGETSVTYFLNSLCIKSRKTFTRMTMQFRIQFQFPELGN